jgi:hypothetical protein
VLIVYLATVFVSATLLFVVQPMFARMVLPLLGGSPAVWNTALVFYQVALLAGYGYVHGATSRLRPPVQMALHLILMLAALLCLPIVVPHGWVPPVTRNPVPWLLGVMTLRIGLPFLVVSSTGPLIQKWFATARHRLSPDPYFLYAASNLGSMLGLLSYPLLVEPHLTLAAQTRMWSIGYGALIVLTCACAWLVRRSLAAESRAPSAPPSAAGSPAPVPDAAIAGSRDRNEPPTWRRKLRWLLLAFTPVSLMMAVTTHLTTDVAAVPLLWVIPLAIYLLTFILVFARRPLVSHEMAVDVLPLLVLPLVMIMIAQPGELLMLVMAIHLIVLFFAAMVCHGELAKDRPPAGYLTEFYLLLSLGGALGGIFNAIVAPLIFTAVAEFPIALVLSCLMIPASVGWAKSTPRQRILDVALPAALAVAVVLFVKILDLRHIDITRQMLIVMVSILVFPVYSFSRRPVRYALGVGALLLTNPEALENGMRLLHADRSFFGVNRVMVDTGRTFHEFRHGTTLHGVQRIRPLRCREPLGYYARSGPLGDIFDSLARRGPGISIGVAGLGAGAIAAYAEPGERLTYYELDPAVERIASDPRYFCFLQACPAALRVVLGDARLSLAASNERFDVLVLDAYTSDAIPLHLITREAVKIYVDHLAPGGLLAFHISNRYFDLAPVIARLAADAGLTCRVAVLGRHGVGKRSEGWTESEYAVVARTPADIARLDAFGNWVQLKHPAPRVWTDEFASPFSALRHP